MPDNVIQSPIKLLVTHMNPDADAIGACWLFMRFDGSDFEGAELYFVTAGSTVGEDVMRSKHLDETEVVHVDTGQGVFDHHQPDNTERDSATLRVFEYLKNKYKEMADDEALKRVVHHINELDHFAECYWPKATADRYEFMFEKILKGLRQARHFTDHELVDFAAVCLDGIYNSMKIKVSAEDDIQTKGEEFETKWGKSLAIENSNDEVIKLAQKMGYQVVVRKDEERGNIRIKAVPEKDIDLTPVYEKIKEEDDKGDWYLHPAKTMLLNSSAKHADHAPTKLSLQKVKELIMNI